MEQEKFRQRREAWAHFLRYLPLHHGRWTRLVHRDGTTSHSFLGVGLHTIMDREPDIIRWEEPQPVNSGLPADQGLCHQAVADTTATLAEYYALTPEDIDGLDEMDRRQTPRETLGRRLREAGFHLPQESTGAEKP